MGIPKEVIEFEADFAPYQPQKQIAVDGIRTLQFSHKKDIIAGNKAIINAEYEDTSTKSSNKFFYKKLIEITSGKV